MTPCRPRRSGPRRRPSDPGAGRWVSPLLTGVGRWLTKCFLVEPLALHPFTYLLQLVYIGRFGSRWLVDTLQLLTTWRRHYRVESKLILGYLANENDLRCLEATTKLSRSTRYEPSPFQKWKKRNTVCRIAVTFFSELTGKSGVKIMLTTNFAPQMPYMHRLRLYRHVDETIILILCEDTGLNQPHLSAAVWFQHLNDV